MGFGVGVLLVGVWVLGQRLGFASAEFDALDCIVTANGTVLETDYPPDGLKYAQEGLDAHNKFRKKHGTPPLVMNPRMCNSSQWTANWNAAWSSPHGGMNHTSDIIVTEQKDKMKCGENMMWSSGPKLILATEAVQGWYSEIKYYDFAKNEGKPGTVFLHFTQLLWKGSKEMCMSYAQRKNGEYYVVAHYFPPGNWAGTEAFAANVLNSNNANNDHFKTGTILILTLCVQFF